MKSCDGTSQIIIHNASWIMHALPFDIFLRVYDPDFPQKDHRDAAVLKPDHPLYRFFLYTYLKDRSRFPQYAEERAALETITAPGPITSTVLDAAREYTAWQEAAL